MHAQILQRVIPCHYEYCWLLPCNNRYLTACSYNYSVLASFLNQDGWSGRLLYTTSAGSWEDIKFSSALSCCGCKDSLTEGRGCRVCPLLAYRTCSQGSMDIDKLQARVRVLMDSGGEKSGKP